MTKHARAWLFRCAQAALAIAIIAATAFADLPEASAQTSSDRNLPLSPPEFDAVINEIQRMVVTKDNDVHRFVVHEATPERIQRLYNMPALLKQRTVIRENGLIFAGQGTLLSFDKPSDVINKVASWFPEEVAAARQAPELRFFTHLHLYGPYASWQDEPAAFMAMWNCMPQIAWLTPDADPFRRRLKISSLTMWGVAATSSDPQEGDFGFCVRERSGLRPAETPAARQANQQEVRSIGERVTATLPGKFSRFLARQGCSGTGPDDCVLVLHLWASLAPVDPDLASALARLEPLVQLDAPLPPLQKPAAQYGAGGQEGEPRFDAVLRQGAFLRAKLASVLKQPAAWPTDALASTLHQMTTLERKMAQAIDHRWYYYELGYYNALVNPWGPLGHYLAESPTVRDAVMAEINAIGEDDQDCNLHRSWLDSYPDLLNRFVLQHLQEAPSNRCAKPDWSRIKAGATPQAVELRQQYLNLLARTPSDATRDEILSQFTSNGDDCFNAQGKPALKWQVDLCRAWIHEPQLTPLALRHSKLTLDKRHQFDKVIRQAPTAGENGAIKPDQRAWLGTLTQGMHADAVASMRTYAEALWQQHRLVRQATHWRHPGHSRSLIELDLADNEGTRIDLILTPHGLQELTVPSRLYWPQDRPDIVRVSDLDADGHLELWWSKPFDECHGDSSDLARNLDCSATSAMSATMGEANRNGVSYFVDDRPTHPTVPAGENWRSRPNGITTKRPDQIPEERPTCNRILLGSFLSDQLEVSFSEPQEESSGYPRLIDLTCKPHPLHPNLALVALFHELREEPNADGNTAKGFVMAVVDIQRRRLIRLYRDKILEDAGTRISEFSLHLDTAPYNIAPGVRAFGVRMNIGYSPRYAEGGESDYLTLFIEHGKTLRPIIQNMPMSSWRMVGDTAHCFDDAETGCAIENKAVRLALASTSTHGWRDLEVITTTSIGDTNTQKARVQVTGKLRAQACVYH
ncbi:hypothetical protein JY96_03540 [Aquabacterium sp. NJ1]|uniref:hypothetical protein n=1 Tax=Aquabacterium sp. NJ1 TaxID=1538295 RepID=UPI00052D3A2A|nr:hypothetical protein [Aquabacterium sp. NJ1]KGM39410.1 hypothetical protein JY96_03540 [Aquabacterium sp. NJ1]